MSSCKRKECSTIEILVRENERLKVRKDVMRRNLHVTNEENDRLRELIADIGDDILTRVIDVCTSLAKCDVEEIMSIARERNIEKNDGFDFLAYDVPPWTGEDIPNNHKITEYFSKERPVS